jgi:hypothetical protein
MSQNPVGESVVSPPTLGSPTSAHGGVGITGPIGPFGSNSATALGVGGLSTAIGSLLGIAEPAPEWLVKLVREKHLHYVRLARTNSYLYYAGRIIVGLCSVLLPFVVGSSKSLATGLSVVIAVTIVLDIVLRPRENWELYSKASDLLTIAEAKLLGQYEKYKDVLDAIVSVESRKVEQLIDLKTVLDKVTETTKLTTNLTPTVTLIPTLDGKALTTALAKAAQRAADGNADK